MTITSWGEAGSAIIGPIANIFSNFVNSLPSVIVALVIVAIGYIVAAIIGHALRLILEKIGLDKYVEKAHLTKAVGHTHLGGVLAEILKWYIFIVFLGAAVSQLPFGVLTSLLSQLTLWLPNIIAAVLVVLVGFLVAHYVKFKIEQHSKMKGALVAGRVLKTVIIIIALILALQLVGVETSLLSNLVLIIIGAIAIGIALALGIGLGLGLKKEGETWINDVKKNL